MRDFRYFLIITKKINFPGREQSRRAMRGGDAKSTPSFFIFFLTHSCVFVAKKLKCRTKCSCFQCFCFFYSPIYCHNIVLFGRQFDFRGIIEKTYFQRFMLDVYPALLTKNRLVRLFWSKLLYLLCQIKTKCRPKITIL